MNFRRSLGSGRLRFSAFFMACLGGAALALVSLTPKPVVLMWDYQTNLMETNMTFVLHGTNDVTAANWPVTATFPATNWYSNSICIAPIVGSNYTMTVTQMVSPQAFFWYVTASNYWGESDGSNIAATPPTPRSDVNFRIGRGW